MPTRKGPNPWEANLSGLPRERATTYTTRLARGLTSLELDPPEERACERCQGTFTARYTEQRICHRCVDDQARLDAATYREARAEEARASFARAGLRGDLIQMTFARFSRDHEPTGYDAAQRYVGAWPDEPILTFLGPPGTGKTHLAAAIVHAVLGMGHAARFVDWPGEVAALKRAERWHEQARKLFDDLYALDQLVLDDVGREKDSAALTEQLFPLLNRRYSEGRPTVLTTNTTYAEFVGTDRIPGYLSGALASRIGSGRLVQLSGLDRRIERIHVAPPRLAIVDPTRVCDVCQGAGWLRDSAVKSGRPERLIKCPHCLGKGY